MKPSHLIILLLMNLCWAGVYSAYKVMGHELPTGGIVTLRFGLAGALPAAAWPWLPGAAPRGRDLVNTCLMGLVCCGGAALAGLWQPTGHRRQFRRPHGRRAADHLAGGGPVPARAYRPPAAGGFRAGHVRRGLAERRMAQRLSMDRAGAELDLHLLVRVRGGLLRGGQADCGAGQRHEDAGHIPAGRHGGKPAH